MNVEISVSGLINEEISRFRPINSAKQQAIIGVKRLRAGISIVYHLCGLVVSVTG
jgi:hypothetical protein